MKASGLVRVRKIAVSLPNVEEGSTFGFPAFKVAGKTFVWFPKKKEVEPGTLGVRMGFVERDYLVAKDPAVFYVTPHYQDYPLSVLARVDAMSDRGPAWNSLSPAMSSWSCRQRLANGPANERPNVAPR